MRGVREGRRTKHYEQGGISRLIKSHTTAGQKRKQQLSSENSQNKNATDRYIQKETETDRQTDRQTETETERRRGEGGWGGGGGKEGRVREVMEGIRAIKSLTDLTYCVNHYYL